MANKIIKNKNMENKIKKKFKKIISNKIWKKNNLKKKSNIFFFFFLFKNKIEPK